MFFPGSRKEQHLRSHLPGIEQGSLLVLTHILCNGWGSQGSRTHHTTRRLLSCPTSLPAVLLISACLPSPTLTPSRPRPEV